ncbi:MAG TPA: hypothetical protein VGN88_11020, partial [Phycisphaerae bacterium]
CFGRPLVQRTKSEGENPAYYVLGQTDAGRYLFCVVLLFPDGMGYPVTTAKEKRRFNYGKTDDFKQTAKDRLHPETRSVLGHARFDRFPG